ncbi:MAG: class I SAM-dependent methyltransferase [Candidatus Limnocylindrales bacterium]
MPGDTTGGPPRFSDRAPIVSLSDDDGVMTELPAGPRPFELLDAGDGRRLERFGERIVDRPAPSAPWPQRAAPEVWAAADLRFERDAGWTGRSDRWTIMLDGLTLELRPTDAGQVGFFPEQVTFWPWLRAALAGRPDPAVLHLFAHTGATTLALARASARVTHVDGSRPAVGWARHNAELAGLADRPIRWIVDDALAFARREARRGRRYDGFVLDPPSFGHGPRGDRWDLDDALAPLLDACAALAADDAFVLLTAHTTGLDPDDLGDALVDAFEPAPGSEATTESIELVATSGAILRLGAAARMIRG